MAMNGDMLGQEIASAVMASDATPEAKAAVTDFYKKLGNAIIAHITANAEVPAGISVSTTGSPSAQKGATTAPGKIT